MRRMLVTAALLALATSPALSEGLLNKKQRPVTDIPAPAAAEPFNWTGFYLGAHGGTILDGDATFTYTQAGNFEPANRPRPVDLGSEWLYGAHAGYQFQMPSGIVLGAEAGATFGKASGVLKENPPPVGNDYRTTAELGPIYSVTGRLGYAWDRLLIYGKAGWAWSDVDFKATFFNKDGPGGTNGSVVKISNKFDVDGLVWGGGAELALTQNITLGVEYQRIDFGDTAVATLKTTNSGILTEKVKADSAIDSIMARLNFKF